VRKEERERAGGGGKEEFLLKTRRQREIFPGDVKRPTTDRGDTPISDQELAWRFKNRFRVASRLR